MKKVIISKKQSELFNELLILAANNKLIQDSIGMSVKEITAGILELHNDIKTASQYKMKEYKITN